MKCRSCHHAKESHNLSRAYPSEILCYTCFGGTYIEYRDAYHAFEWDNLDLIEHLAKERNLI